MNIKTIVKLVKQNSELLGKFSRMWNAICAVKVLMMHYQRIIRLRLAIAIMISFAVFGVNLNEKEMIDGLLAMLGMLILLMLVVLGGSFRSDEIIDAKDFIKAISVLEKVVGVEFGKERQLTHTSRINPWWNEELLTKISTVYLVGLASNVKYWQRCPWREKETRESKDLFVEELDLLCRLLKKLPTNHEIYFSKEYRRDEIENLLKQA